LNKFEKCWWGGFCKLDLKPDRLSEPVRSGSSFNQIKK
jgi:hypothetical protein